MAYFIEAQNQTKICPEFIWSCKDEIQEQYYSTPQVATLLQTQYFSSDKAQQDAEGFQNMSGLYLSKEKSP